jgi:hypothetical protein
VHGTDGRPRPTRAPARRRPPAGPRPFRVLSPRRPGSFSRLGAVRDAASFPLVRHRPAPLAPERGEARLAGEERDMDFRRLASISAPLRERPR